MEREYTPVTSEKRSAPAAAAGQGAAGSAPPIIIQTQRSTWSRVVNWIGWTGFILCGLALMGLLSQLSDYFDTSDGITEKFHSGKEFGQNKVAIITISGAILEGDGFAKKQIERIRKDDKVKALVVRVDSPGGTVTGSDYLFHHLKKLRQEKIEKHGSFPLVVSMGGIAASGGYYVAMAVGDQEKAIFAEPTTTTGSIGVIIPHYDISGFLERYDIKDDSVATHPRKQMLSMTKPMSPEERELLTAYIYDSFSRFKEVVKEGRPHFKKDEDALTQLATGEIFTASQAKKTGLIDEIGFLEDAVDRALELADLDKKKTRIVKFEQPLGLFDFGMASARSSNVQLEMLIELSTPKAYYLSTSLPPLVTTAVR